MKDGRAAPGGRGGTEHADEIYGDVLYEIDPNGKTAWEWDAA